MKRIKDDYLKTIESVTPFEGKRVLEIGCGNGSRTIQIAERCREVVAIEPNGLLVAEAKTERGRSNISYQEGSADCLTFEPHVFDIVFFTLSFHHVPTDRMTKAIEEALRVVTDTGYIIFLEPAFTGSFFDAEIRFNACDGDERKEKAAAYTAILSDQHLTEVAELTDETIFSFDGVEDFMTSLQPKKGTKDEIESYLKECDFVLNANRRINIFQRRSSS